jgi:tetratricopeptide (TPR) repeat protein
LTATVLPPRGGAEYLPIVQSQPIARIGKSIFVYQGRFEVPLAAALSHAERANRLIILNRFEEAVAEGQTAVELAPTDPRTRLSLGMALIRAGQKDEARQELEKAIELAKPNPVFRNAEVRAQQEIELLN